MSRFAIAWADEPDGKHYTAAYDWLSLLWDSERAEQAIERLRNVPVIELPAANVCQTAGFDPLPLHDPGVLRELRRACTGRPRGPLLCVHTSSGVVIADGHHRLSASYGLDPFASVRLKLA